MADKLHATAPIGAEAISANGLRLALAPLAEAASLGAFAGSGRAELLACVRAEFGVDLPQTPKAVTTADGLVTFLWCGPSQWLALAPAEASGPSGASSGGQGLMARLRASCGAVCALSAQGDSRTALRLSGPGTRAVLSRLVPVDLHPRAFRAGDVALTLAGHIPVIVRHLDDQPEACELLVFRSFAASLFHDLHVAMTGHTS
ncbi:sarcosine oxidase subunit gamma [Acetobacter sp. TBRC 12305]|uniref:Sarcosine oxidase subunit gamma n=1 Tax=Acetobacter garciniae TaxID=2817435 RepID=A0A939KMI9_9PROT|nr:sarcosine oxidase subunit gamma family protein [Acetobacter garciniae]MBO1324625.1 sarcosine oxidase subunit gamma [Acetobacter garciniae]MBX0344314.1 sarcosine oxidase subunit gamma [Acetobacter garciniae]